MIGIANIVGRLLTGWIANFHSCSVQLFKNVDVVICGIAVFTMPFCVERYDGFVISAIVFGFSSSFVILKTLIIVDLVGKKRCFYITFNMSIFENLFSELNKKSCIHLFFQNPFK